jgi:acetamidase/formamidase
VDVIKLTPASWGWTGIIPGFGLLAEEGGVLAKRATDLTTPEEEKAHLSSEAKKWSVLNEPAVHIWKLHFDEESGTGYTYFDEPVEGESDSGLKRIKIPLKPFCGEMGVAPAKPGAHSTIPPYKTGGNVDTKWLSMGSRLYLPVEVEGALFSCGDGHAVQGDGGELNSASYFPSVFFIWRLRSDFV